MMTLVDDPLIAGMSIARTLPLHESSGRLRGLYPECPRVYGVAMMSDLTRRRWWPLREALTDRLQEMFETDAQEIGSPVAAAQQLAATLAHVVIGRVIPLVVLEGRAWDTGLENLWVHVDSEGAIDWVGVVDPALRALPDDPFFYGRADACAADYVRDGMVRLPSEAALTTWVAHRSHRALEPLFAKLFDIGGGHLDGVDVAHRRRRGGGYRHACSAAGQVQRVDQHAARAGGARRARRLRPAGSRRTATTRGEGLA
jgi:hypothetical protein